MAFGGPRGLMPRWKLPVGAAALLLLFFSAAAAQEPAGAACSQNTNRTCEECLKNVSCLWCNTNKACVDYPVSRILPPSSLCALSSARWGVCWGESSCRWAPAESVPSGRVWLCAVSTRCQYVCSLQEGRKPVGVRALRESSRGSPGGRRPTTGVGGRGPVCGLCRPRLGMLCLGGVWVPGVLLGPRGQVPAFLCPFPSAHGGSYRRSLFGGGDPGRSHRDQSLDQGALAF